MLICLEENELRKTISDAFYDKYKFLVEKKYIDAHGKRIKSFKDLDVIPSELFTSRDGCIIELEGISSQKRKSHDGWDEGLLSPPRKKQILNQQKNLQNDQVPKWATQLISTTNFLALEVAKIRSNPTNNKLSPQKQSTRQMLSNNKRDITRFNREYAVDKTTIGFELITTKSDQLQQQSFNNAMYEKMMNLKTNKNVVDHIQGLCVCPRYHVSHF